MDEYVIPTVLGRDQTETLGVVEPLDRTETHCVDLCNWGVWVVETFEAKKPGSFLPPTLLGLDAPDLCAEPPYPSAPRLGAGKSISGF
jgi:hypothetical protein